MSEEVYIHVKIDVLIVSDLSLLLSNRYKTITSQYSPLKERCCTTYEIITGLYLCV